MGREEHACHTGIHEGVDIGGELCRVLRVVVEDHGRIRVERGRDRGEHGFRRRFVVRRRRWSFKRIYRVRVTVEFRVGGGARVENNMVPRRGGEYGFGVGGKVAHISQVGNVCGGFIEEDAVDGYVGGCVVGPVGVDGDVGGDVGGVAGGPAGVDVAEEVDV